MSELLFGTAGVPHSSKTNTSIDGIRRIAELGLGCMELEFVQGVRMSEAGARLVAEVAAETGIKLSVHAPYFINFNAHEPEKITASQERLLQTARITSLCGGQSVVFHPAFYLGDPPEKAYDTVKKYLKEVLEQLKKENIRLWLRPEVMGRDSQFGTVEEILALSTELEGLAPCLDFAHWHARRGTNNSYEEFASVLKQIEERLGRKALDNMHIHTSGIAFGKKGEIKHLNLKDSDLNFVELIKALKDYQVKGMLICESPNLEEDALLLQQTYNSLTKAG
ncbi:MAG: TIM barrel protein [Dehalococcoidales bacterium]|nr:TIM barrel protein [Dehalococcoidales bacterium]